VFQEFFRGEDFDSIVRVLQFQDINLYHLVTYLRIVNVKFSIYNMYCITWST